MAATLDCALYLASMGVPVFPVAIRAKKGAGNKADKKPLISDNLNRASTDATQIRRWWKHFPNDAIGGVLSALGWLVIDVDVHGDKDGFADLRRLEESFGPLPRTVTVRTATGGLHLWFQLPAGVEIRVSNIPGHDAPGVDIKGHGGWLVMPGSHSPFGEYTFEDGLSLGDLRPADLPKRWLEALQADRPAAKSPRQRVTRAASPTAYWEAVLDAISQAGSMSGHDGHPVAASGRVLNDEVVVVFLGPAPDECLVEPFLVQLEKWGLAPVWLSSLAGDLLVVRCQDASLRLEVRGAATDLGLRVAAAGESVPSLFTDAAAGAVEPTLVEPAGDPYEVLGRLCVPFPQRLSRRVTALIRYGDPLQRYKSGSHVIQAIVQNAVGLGAWFHELLDLLLDDRNLGGRRIREEELSGRGAPYLRQSWEKALIYARQSPPTVDGPLARSILDRLGVQVRLSRWPAKRANDRQVLLAIMWIAHRAARFSFSASYRQIANEANLPLSVVERSLDRLQDDGWLVRTGTNDHTTTLWQLSTATPASGTGSLYVGTSVIVCTVPLEEVLALTAHDAFASLGQRALWVFEWLRRGLTTQAEIARASGMAPGTVGKCLERMERVGLTKRTGRLWEPTDRNLDEVAEQLGVLGTGETRRARHRAEREAHRRLKAEVRLRDQRTAATSSASSEGHRLAMPLHPAR